MPKATYKIHPNAETPFGSIDDLLAASMELNKPILIFTNDLRPNEYVAGIVAMVFEEWFVFKRIDPLGRADGYSCIPLDIVFRAEADTQLVNRITTLWKIQGDAHRALAPTETDLLTGFLENARASQTVVSLEILDSRVYDLTGFVQHLDDAFVKIGLLDPYGTVTGATLISIDSITQASMDSLEERALQKLHDYNLKIGNLT